MTEILETADVGHTGAIRSTEQVQVSLFRQAPPDGHFLDMALIPAGTFQMGGPHAKGHRDEEPQHFVNVGAFYVSQTTVTQAQLFDMHGNLDEWCSDSWHEDYEGAPLNGEPWIRGGTQERVIRGGSWHDPPVLCRSSARLKLRPSEGEDFMGLRVALSA